jgi:hypothetical protein
VQSHLDVWKDEMQLEGVQVHGQEWTDVGMVQSLGEETEGGEGE